jgi:predicted ATPase
MISSRFIRSLSIDWDKVPQDSYLRGILALTRLDELELTHDVTIFAGENGTGKSTLLEAIAVAAGFNREGGRDNRGAQGQQGGERRPYGSRPQGQGSFNRGPRPAAPQEGGNN